ncbi:MAG: hypothetical protein ACLFTT_06655 [Candidatus Hydrogenedentota bacterium]
MPLAKCPRCGNMFNKDQDIVCHECQEAEEKDYEKVRAVIENSPNLNMDEVATKADVDIACVKRMLEQGVITTKVEGGEGVRCGMCGAPAISISKRLCQACLDKLNTQMFKAQSQVKLSARRKPDLGNTSVHDALDEKRRRES